MNIFFIIYFIKEKKYFGEHSKIYYIFSMKRGASPPGGSFNINVLKYIFIINLLENLDEDPFYNLSTSKVIPLVGISFHTSAKHS